MLFNSKTYYFFIFAFATNVFAEKCLNNACTNYFSYIFLLTSPKCYCIPNIGKETNEVVDGLIGVSETHHVVTEDGYIIGIFRMPRKNPKGVVILHHPVVVSSRIWVCQGNLSTGLLFWQQGYDVWMPNNRGTMYSKNHTTLSTSDPKFWDFSFHEIGYYDHKAAIDYIYNITKQKIIFVGHSMSTTTSLIYSALRPKEAEEKLKINIAMGSISYLKYITTPVALLARVMPLIEFINKLFHNYSLLGLHAWYTNIARVILLANPFKFILIALISLFCGWTPLQYQVDYAQILILQGISEVSWKTFYHYAQVRDAPNGRFQMYDYGKKENIQRYGQDKPPVYPVENITIPTYLVYSKDDTFSVPKDNKYLYSLLSNNATKYGQYEYSGFNHVDVHFGKDRVKTVYNPIFKLLSSL